MNIQDIPTDVLIAELKRREDLNVSNGDPIGLLIMKEIDKARKEFGDYPFCDKGADEVMEIESIINELETMDVKSIAKSLSFVLDNYKDKQFSYEAVNTIIADLDGIEDFDSLFDFDKRFQY